MTANIICGAIFGSVFALIGFLILHWFAGREIRKSEERSRAAKLAFEAAHDKRLERHSRERRDAR
jgi:hypothetical protein